MRGDHEMHLSLAEEDTDSIQIEILGKYTRPVFVHFESGVYELAIVFKPMGINHFISDDFSAVAKHFSQPYADTEWTEPAKRILSLTDQELQINALEDFLLSRVRYKDTSAIDEAVSCLGDHENADSITTIASKVNMTLKTLQRHFFRYMSCTPADYRRIARFRHSLNKGLFAKELKKLTSLAYDSNYYDQSYFVKEYRKLTNHSPKALFDSITVMDNRKIIWKIK